MNVADAWFPGRESSLENFEENKMQYIYILMYINLAQRVAQQPGWIPLQIHSAILLQVAIGLDIGSYIKLWSNITEVFCPPTPEEDMQSKL